MGMAVDGKIIILVRGFEVSMISRENFRGTELSKSKCKQTKDFVLEMSQNEFHQSTLHEFRS